MELILFFKTFKSNSGIRGKANYSQGRGIVNAEILPHPQPAALLTPQLPFPSTHQLFLTLYYRLAIDVDGGEQVQCRGDERAGSWTEPFHQLCGFFL